MYVREKQECAPTHSAQTWHYGLWWHFSSRNYKAFLAVWLMASREAQKPEIRSSLKTELFKPSWYHKECLNPMQWDSLCIIFSIILWKQTLISHFLIFWASLAIVLIATAVQWAAQADACTTQSLICHIFVERAWKGFVINLTDISVFRVSF